MFEQLDDFSRRIAFQVIERFPEWKSLAVVGEYDGEKYWELKVPSPLEDARYPLCIDTSGGEVTVSVEDYHAHFDEFEDTENEDALSFIKQLLSEEFAVISYWRDEKWCGSTLLSRDEFPTTNSEYPYANKIKIRSWTGQYNHEIKCTPKD